MHHSTLQCFDFPTTRSSSYKTCLWPSNLLPQTTTIMAPTSKPGAKSNASKRKQSTEDSPISPVRAVQNKKARTSAAASVDNTKGDAKKDPKVQPLQEKKAVVIDLEGSDSEDDEDDENKHDDGGTFSPEIRVSGIRRSCTSLNSPTHFSGASQLHRRAHRGPDRYIPQVHPQ